jgi:hypothetical protein
MRIQDQCFVTLEDIKFDATASLHTVPKEAFHKYFQAWQNCCSKCVRAHARTQRGAVLYKWSDWRALMGCTTPLTSRRCILYTYSTNICTEYFLNMLHTLHIKFWRQRVKCYGWILATLWYTYGTVLLAHYYSTFPTTSEALNVWCDELFCSLLIEVCVMSCRTAIVLILWSSRNLQQPQFCFSVANRW